MDICRGEHIFGQTEKTDRPAISQAVHFKKYCGSAWFLNFSKCWFKNQSKNHKLWNI